MPADVLATAIREGSFQVPQRKVVAKMSLTKDEMQARDRQAGQLHMSTLSTRLLISLLDIQDHRRRNSSERAFNRFTQG